MLELWYEYQRVKSLGIFHTRACPIIIIIVVVVIIIFGARRQKLMLDGLSFSPSLWGCMCTRTDGDGPVEVVYYTS